MAVVQNRFDAGSFGTAITVANSGGTASGNAFNVVSTLTGQTLTYDNVQNVREGYAVQAADGSTPGRACVGWTTSIGTQTVIYLRFNIWIGGVDLNDSYYAAVLSGGATTSPLRAAIGLEAANQNLAIFDASGAVIPGTEVAGNWQNFWLRIEAQLTLSTTAAAGSCIMKVYSNPNGTTPDFTVNNSNPANLGGSGDTYVFGICDTNNGPSRTQWMDNVGVSTVGFLGPATFDASALDAPSVADANAKAFLPTVNASASEVSSILDSAKALPFTNVAVSDQTSVAELKDANVAVTLSESVKLLAEENAIASDVTGVGESFRISLLSISVSDSTSPTTDVLSVRSELDSSVGDATATSDAAVATIGISVRESVATSERVIAGDLSISISEATGTAEQTVVILGNLVTVASDSLTTTETLAEVTTNIVSRTETTTAAESVVAVIPLLLTVSDSTTTSELRDANVAVTLSESVTIGFVGPVSVSDATGAADAPFTASDGGISVSETVATSDSDVTALPFAAIKVDTASTSEAVSLQTSNPQIVAADAARTQEAQQAFFEFNVFASDGCATSEVVASQCPGPVAMVDTVATGDSASAAVVGSFQVAIFEALVVVEGRSATGILLVSVSDVASLPPGGPVFDDVVAVSDTIGTSDVAFGGLSTLFVSAADAATVADTQAVGQPLSPFSVFASDQAAGAEFFVIGTSPTITFTLEAVVADSLVTSEGVVGNSPSTTISRSATDAPKTSESVAAQQDQYNALAAETVVANEQPFIAGDRFIAVVDVSGTTDAPAEVIGQSFSAADVTSVTESIALVRTAPASFSIAVSETASTAEFFVVGMPPIIVFGTSATANDSIVASENAGAALSVSIADEFVVGIEAVGTAETLRFSGLSSVAARETTVSSDQAVVSFSFSVSVSDATATSESAAGAIALSSTTADVSTTSETISAAGSALSVSTSEQVNSSEFVNAIPLFPFEVNAQEGPTVREAFTAVIPLEVSLADTTTLVDATRDERIFLVASSDNITSSEALQSSGEIVISTADASVSSEATSISSIVLVTNPVDTLATAETVTLFVSVQTSAADTTSTTDAAVLSFVSASFDAETIATQDVLTSRLTSLLSKAEIAATSEARLATLISLVQTNESASVGESVFLEVVAALGIVDTTASLDFAQASVTVAATALERTSVTEVVRFSFAGSVGRTETVTTADSVSVNIGLSLSATSQIATSESFAVRPEHRAAASDQASAAENVAILPDLLLRASDALATTDAVFPGNDLFRFIADAPSSLEKLVAELTTGFQPTPGLESVGAKEYLALAIKSPWGPLLPADVIPTSDEGDATSIWQSTYRPTQFVPS